MCKIETIGATLVLLSSLREQIQPQHQKHQPNHHEKYQIDTAVSPVEE